MNGIIAASRRRETGEVPSVPTNLLIGLGSLCQTTFTLQWTASTGEPTGYKIYRNGTLFLDTESTSTSQAITGQTAGSTNTWTVSAYNNVGESDESTGLSVTQPPTVNLILMNLTGQASANAACGAITGTSRYITGGNSTPSNGEVVYTNACATAKLIGGGNYYSDGTLSFQVSNDGVISNLAFC